MIHSCDYKEYRVPELGELKAKKGERVSVVIPARNEQATIGPIVTRIGTLRGEPGIVDEIIVIDDASEDATARNAAAAGAMVVQAEECGPGVRASGKGAALWKSQFVTNGSIVVFIDADLLDFDERFVIGCAGSLLCHDHLELVKAAYRRPLINGSSTIENSGGRVTEILVRPLLSLFIPELADLHQPLAGEYAVRSSTLELMHFYSGYGVEIGLLLDYFFTFGLDAIGQVDVGTRAHRNRPLGELYRMSLEIGHVFFDSLERQGYCSFSIPGRESLRLCETDADNESGAGILRLPPKKEVGHP